LGSLLLLLLLLLLLIVVVTMVEDMRVFGFLASKAERVDTVSVRSARR
jgi:hypothetical protein